MYERSNKKTKIDLPQLETPHYTQCILEDIYSLEIHIFIYTTLNYSENYKKVLLLLKVWIMKRNFNNCGDSIDGYLMTLFICLFHNLNVININMNLTQLLHSILRYFGNSISSLI